MTFFSWSQFLWTLQRGSVLSFLCWKVFFKTGAIYSILCSAEETDLLQSQRKQWLYHIYWEMWCPTWCCPKEFSRTFLIMCDFYQPFWVRDPNQGLLPSAVYTSKTRLNLVKHSRNFVLWSRNREGGAHALKIPSPQLERSLLYL